MYIYIYTYDSADYLRQINKSRKLFPQFPASGQKKKKCDLRKNFRLGRNKEKLPRPEDWGKHSGRMNFLLIGQLDLGEKNDNGQFNSK